MSPLNNLRRIVAGWRGEWRVDAHEGITLSHDGDEWPIDDMDGDVMIALVELLNAIRPAVDGATAETARLTAELAAERRSDREAVAFANDAAIGDFIDGHAKRLCEQAGEHWTGDGEQLDAWAAKVHDVLNHLRADADGAVIDGRASQTATVGGLLAMAPVGSIVECVLAGAPCQVRMYTDDGEEWCEFRKWFNGGWREWAHGLAPMRTPARLVPAHLADADPASRGPIGEG